MLDSLLAAGDGGQSLQPCHLPHLQDTKLRVALPALLVPHCFHVAEIDFSSRRIRYMEILGEAEANRHQNLALLHEAQEYSLAHWSDSLLRVEPCRVQQTRDRTGNCIWSAFGRQGNMMMKTEHKSDFMELARQCVVTYDN